jgi:hypothetical protein
VIKVEVHGLKEFRREIKKVDRALGRELRQVHLKVADLVAGRARGAAPGGVKGAIGSKATQKAAFVQIRNRPARALAVFMGMKRRSGWYAAGRYRSSQGRQFEPWVGNQWDPGEFGGDPYYIGPAINRSVDDVLDLYGDELEKLARRAYPS